MKSEKHSIEIPSPTFTQSPHSTPTTEPEASINTVAESPPAMDELNKKGAFDHLDNVEAKSTDDSRTEEIPQSLTTFPEGGFGWFVVFGAFMIQFCCFGFNFSWGVYQEYYVQNNIFPGSTLSQISWVGGIGAASIFITGPFQPSMVQRFGLWPVIAVGIVISGTGMILASFATEVWHVYLTQGLLFGLGAGMSLFTSIAVPTQWFREKRGLASGITVAGSGAGGAALAPLNRYLISRVGHKWALRTMGVGSIGVVLSVLWCIRPRLLISKRKGPIFDFSLFSHRGFTTMYLMGVLVTFGYLTPVFLLPKYITDMGMDPKTGANLVSIYSGVNAISRILLGIAADKFGRYNMLFLSTALSGVACYALWLNTKGTTMAVIFSVFYGMNGGGFVSLFPVVAAEVIGIERLSVAIGLLYSGNLFGNLLGAPIASAIVTASGGDYTWGIVFAGTSPILGALLLLSYRLKVEPRLFAKV
ncbi:hypothetical protein BGW38_001082 [Lunasporangiospora selenospora]|uniref:Major facilitator superfamily (MFS) profile domain-containing protein n=1 Tax=Lunasporangiospora selenospora TaxID=979761 RepID=A0A9P6KED4_9FUNG|nr:hypothetical protein BGW38_001082 [Lunasporangiospora selenospora]